MNKTHDLSPPNRYNRLTRNKLRETALEGHRHRGSGLFIGHPADAILVRRWRDGRVAEGARLESVFTLTGNVGSNPTLSAITYPRSPRKNSYARRMRPVIFFWYGGQKLLPHLRQPEIPLEICAAMAT